MGKDRNIFQHGMKVSNDFVGKFVGHKYEVTQSKTNEKLICAWHVESLLVTDESRSAQENHICLGSNYFDLWRVFCL
ncbi:hypothetical protein QL285_075758 [Trifolium repens]|nr:hypothetical protein QL285_075758 [Trifolium repens]